LSSELEFSLGLFYYNKVQFTGIKIEMRNGIRVSERSIKDGKYNGPQKEYYQNGKLKSEGHSVDGVSEGIHRSYYENGLLENESFLKGGVPHGICKSYYDTGILESELSYKNLKNDGTYKNLVKDGNWMTYHKNGRLAWIAFFQNDKPVGQWKWFDEDGNLTESEQF